jgi:hypothetical protein
MLLGAARARDHVLRAADTYLLALVEVNWQRVTNDLHERVLQSRRALEEELRGRIRTATELAARALASARRARAEGQDAVRAELDGLAAARARLASMDT